MADIDDIYQWHFSRVSNMCPITRPVRAKLLRVLGQFFLSTPQMGLCASFMLTIDIPKEKV